MYTEYEIRQIPLTLKSSRTKVESFLQENGLRLAPLDYMAGIYRLEEDEILACGGLEGGVMKCLAVSEKLRDTGMSSRLISHLVSVALAEGHSSVRVFTKPENKQIFSSLGFTLLSQAPKAILMESSSKPLDSYCDYLNGLRKPGRNGVIVMNANPFTRGHRYLVETAAAQVDNLYVIAVKEDRSRFLYPERLEMIRSGCQGLRNVTVCEGSDYSISELTFPTYFLKNLDDSAPTYMALDLDLFCSRIAPALGAAVRFAGTEPADPLTCAYNAVMREYLRAKGLDFVEIPRLEQDGEVVSASVLRSLMDRKRMNAAFKIAFPPSVPYIIALAACEALQAELDATPKPGLVDKAGSGAHKDMDYALMSRSIRALRPYFLRLACCGFKPEAPDAEEIRAIGIEAEKAMLEATGGVNTHRGALFCMGLSVCAAAHSVFKNGKACPEEILEGVSAIARQFPAAGRTHGAEVVGKYGVKGALECAVEGYPQLQESWLPALERYETEDLGLQKVLLVIMSSLEDTNIYYRRGPQVADRVKKESKALLEDFSQAGLESLDRDFVRENISPGGAADMLSLTIFIRTFVG